MTDKSKKVQTQKTVLPLFFMDLPKELLLMWLLESIDRGEVDPPFAEVRGLGLVSGEESLEVNSLEEKEGSDRFPKDPVGR